MRTYTVKLLPTFFKTWSKKVGFLQSLNYNLPSKFISRFLKSLNYLKLFPNGFQSLESTIYRKLVINKKYVIIYFVDNTQRNVYVKYVFSTKQDYLKLIS